MTPTPLSRSKGQRSRSPGALLIAAFLCDCLAAVDTITKCSGSLRQLEVFDKLQTLLEPLYSMNVAVHLAWIPGHAGIERGMNLL